MLGDLFLIQGLPLLTIAGKKIPALTLTLPGLSQRSNHTVAVVLVVFIVAIIVDNVISAGLEVVTKYYSRSRGSN